MPVYKYKAINNVGSAVQGIIDAESIKAATEKLKREGVYLSSIRESASSKLPLIRNPFKGVSISEIAVTTRQFSALISAGLPLESSLLALSEQAEDPKLKEVLAQVRDKVTEGSSLHKALEEHKSIFSDLYTNIVKAGEASGALDVVLHRLADFLEKQSSLRSKVRGAMIYPAIMFIVGMGVLFFMLAFVIPKISKIFESSNSALPFITIVLIETSNFIRGNFILIIIMLAAILFFLYRYSKTEKGKRISDRISLK
ncbi:MAG: type II secretion system F family protein, partial [Thermodesulfobacteriota bacterium]